MAKDVGLFSHETASTSEAAQDANLKSPTIRRVQERRADL